MEYSYGPDIKDTEAFSNHGKLKNWSTEKPHSHRYDQILLIESGVSILEDGTKRLPQYSGMAAFIPAGAPHRTEVTGTGVKYRSIYMGTSFFKASMKEIAVFSPSPLAVSLVDRLCGRRLEPLVSQTERDCLKLLVRIIKEDVSANRFPLTLPLPKRQENRLMAHYIHEHYAENTGLASITSVVPVTERHASRIFREETGITINSYLRLYRVFRASVLLETTDRAITEICYSCGYESLSSLYRDFSLYFPVSPGEFRKKR